MSLHGREAQLSNVTDSGRASFDTDRFEQRRTCTGAGQKALTFRSAMVGLRSDVLFLSLFLARVPAGAGDTSRSTAG
jgi:hypothetical protein